MSIVVGNFEDITKKIIPFFDKYLIQGCKYLDYIDWVKIADLMRDRKNKTEEGIATRMIEIKNIESRMNSSRKIN